MTSSKSSSGMAIGPPLTWNDTSACIATRCLPWIELASESEAPPVCTLVIMPAFLAAATSGT